MSSPKPTGSEASEPKPPSKLNETSEALDASQPVEPSASTQSPVPMQTSEPKETSDHQDPGEESPDGELLEDDFSDAETLVEDGKDEDVHDSVILLLMIIRGQVPPEHKGAANEFMNGLVRLKNIFKAQTSEPKAEKTETAKHVDAQIKLAKTITDRVHIDEDIERQKDKPRKKLIVETDLKTDSDDAGALLIAATHPNLDLIGVNVNDPSPYSALAASAILGYYRPNTKIPVGYKMRPHADYHPIFVDTLAYQRSEFASKVPVCFPGGPLKWEGKGSPHAVAERALNPVKLYRDLLSNAEDNSVTIASIGFLDNLSDFLNAPATENCLSGRDLILKKVSELVVMGGNYDRVLKSWNFFGYGTERGAYDVITNWPGRITFSGSETGRNVLTSLPLIASDLFKDPVRMVYRWFQFDVPRGSWDPLAILYIAEGLSKQVKGKTLEMFNQTSDGENTFDLVKLENEWKKGDTEKHHSYLSLKHDLVAEARVDALLLYGAEVGEARSGHKYGNDLDQKKLPLGAETITDIVNAYFKYHIFEGRQIRKRRARRQARLQKGGAQEEDTSSKTGKRHAGKTPDSSTASDNSKVSECNTKSAAGQKSQAAPHSDDGKRSDGGTNSDHGGHGLRDRFGHFKDRLLKR